MQVINLFDYFENLAATHNDIESFGNGDLFEVAIAGEDTYVQLWLEQVIQATSTRGLLSWNVAFIIHAIEKHDESDENALLDKCFTIGQQVIQKIRNDKLYVLGDGVNVVSFTERFEDFTCGWRFEIQLREAVGVDRCDISLAYTSRCNYAEDIRGTEDAFLNSITIDKGPLDLPSLPLQLLYSSSDPPPGAVGTLLRDDLVALGYNALILQQNIDLGKGNTEIRLVIQIRASLDIFLCMMGSSNNTIFQVLCSDCYYVVSDGVPVIGTELNAIVINSGPLPLTTLPLNISLSNPNFDAEALALQNELISLGYEATVADVTPPSAFERSISIRIDNPPVADDFLRIEGSVSNANFNYNCS